ncbi:hypothetical protein SPONL_2185 [uncultured Candidatus Thioglobus sp.]|nr:hypothetical protein SPONL_2185 [uncultured Candidatus Thioglobus sp.]
MKILTATSHFKGTPRSEIWQIDTETHQKKQLMVLPESPFPVSAKGVTGIVWIDNNTLVVCDFNRVLKINRNTWEIIDEKIDEQFNDLHQITNYKGQLLISNTGRDSIDLLDFDFKTLTRHSLLSEKDFQNREAGNYEINDEYYDNPKSGLSFSQKKVPDTHHFNYAFQTDKFKDKIIVNCFYDKCLRDLKTFEIISNHLPNHIHDGVIHNDHLWLTTVSGEIYKSKLELPFQFEIAIDLFKTAPHHGWCRGLFFEDNYAYIGITVLYKNSDRTPWLKQDISQTRTGIYKYNLDADCIEQFYDLSHADGAKIFSIVADRGEL